MLNGRILFDLTLLSGAVWAFVLSRALPASHSSGPIGPSFFPSVVCALGILVLLGALWQDIRAGTNEEGDAMVLNKKKALCAMLVFALLIGYIILIPAIGFRLSTIMFLFIAILICDFGMTEDRDRLLPDVRFSLIAAGAALVSTLLTHAVFTYGFGLNL